MEPNDQAGSAVVSAQLVVSLVFALHKVTATYAEFNHIMLYISIDVCIEYRFVCIEYRPEDSGF